MWEHTTASRKVRATTRSIHHALDRTSAAGRAAVERAPVQIPEIMADPEYTYSGRRFFRTMLGVPIMFEDDLVGVVVVVPPRASFHGRSHRIVQTFADQAAIALTNARLDAVERRRTEPPSSSRRRSRT